MDEATHEALIGAIQDGAERSFVDQLLADAWEDGRQNSLGGINPYR